MKINFGEFKGRNLIIGNNNKMRPTSTIAKSIIFNYLNINCNDKVLDLFGGTGSLGIEALSLGAKHVTITDSNINSVNAIKKNLKEMKIANERYSIYKSDYRQTLKKAKDINIIFLDPPFSIDKYYEDALQLILKNKVLAPDGVIVMEKRIKQEIKNISKYGIIKEKILGGNLILLLKEK